MSFIRHTNCPSCGSKDNLAEYTDGSYCFGCGYTKKNNDLASIRLRLSSSAGEISSSSELDVDYNIPKEAMQWLLQYGVTKHDAETYKIGWNNTEQMLVLVNTPDYYQGRNFSGYGAKYKSKGKKPLLFYGLGDTLVCVEDILSSIKVVKSNGGVCATPLLGSTMPLKLTETILERFKNVKIWLDRDKAVEAVKMARNLKQKGINADVIITPKDPKEYNTGEITEWLRNK